LLLLILGKKGERKKTGRLLRFATEERRNPQREKERPEKKRSGSFTTLYLVW